MYKTVTLYLSILFFINCIFSNDKTLYYDTNDKNGYIHELLLELDEFVGIDTYNDKSIYLKIEASDKETKKVIEWNLRALGLKRSNKYEEGFSGSAKNKFNKTLKQHKTLLEIPLSDFIDDDDELILKNLPIIFKGDEYCHKVITMSIGVQSKLNSNFLDDLNNNEWFKTNYELIISTTEINLKKDYNFNDSDKDLSIDFSILNKGVSTFISNRLYKFIISDKLSWSKDLRKTRLMYDGIEISEEEYTLESSKNILNITFLKNIDTYKIDFKNFLIKSNNEKVSSSIDLWAKLSPTSKKGTPSRNNRRVSNQITKISNTLNTVNIYNVDIQFGPMNEGDFSIINNKKDEIIIPDLYFNQNGDTEFLSNNTVINIIIPESAKLTWGNLTYEYNNFALTKLSDKNIRIILEKDYKNKPLIVPNLFFKKTSRSIESFNLQIQFSSELFDNYEDIYCSDSITKGKVSIDLKDQTVFTSDPDPSIDRLEINYNKKSLLLPKDNIIIDISNSKSLFFNTEQEIKSNQSENLDITVNSQEIIIEIMNMLDDSNESIILENIIFRQPNSSENDISYSTYIKPGRYKDLRSNIKLETDNPAKLSILDISFDLLKEYEIVKDYFKNEGKYTIPDIIIKNNSSESYDIDQIKINIPDLYYKFYTSGLNPLTTNPENSPYCYLETKELITCDIYSSFESGEILTIPDIGIEIDYKKNDSFSNKLLKMEIYSNQEPIPTESIKGISLGRPTMRSLYDQSIDYNDTKFQELYQFTLDFSEIPKTIKTVNKLLIHIENKIDLKWGNRKDAYIVTGDNILNLCPVSFNENSSDIIIDISSIDINQRNRMVVGNLEFKDSGDPTSEFNLYLSLDNGFTWSAKDDRYKKIISQKSSVDIIDKQIIEDIFPFKKGNQLLFIINKNAPFTWDTSIENNPDILNEIFKDEGYDINSNTKMLGNPQIINNGKELIFDILRDIDNPLPGTEPMDYRKKIGLKLLVKKVDEYQDDYKKNDIVSFRIKTMYGERVFDNSKEGITYNKITFSQDVLRDRSQWLNKKQTKIRCDIIMGEPPEGFKEDMQLSWYRYKRQYFHLVSGIMNNEEYDENQKMESLRGKISNIAKVFIYDKDKTYIKQDWLFWYNLGWYKFAWETIVGKNLDFPLNDFGDTQGINLSRTWKKDIENAKEFGYSSNNPSFPPPGEDISPIVDIIVEQIIPKLKAHNYEQAYNMLFDGLYVTKKLGNSGWEEVFCRYLFSFLSDAYFSDKNEIRKKTFSKYQMRLINRILSSDSKEDIQDEYANFITGAIKDEHPEIADMFVDDLTVKEFYLELINNYGEMSIEYSQNIINCDEKDDYDSCNKENVCLWDDERDTCYHVCGSKTENDCMNSEDCSWSDEESICSIKKEIGDVRMSFAWENQNTPKKNDWRVEITNKNDKGLYIPGLDIFTETERVEFYQGNPKSLKGENVYMIKFDKLKKEMIGLTTLGVAGGVILLLLLF